MWEPCLSCGASVSKQSPQKAWGDTGKGLSQFKPLSRVAETQPNAGEAGRWEEVVRRRELQE